MCWHSSQFSVLSNALRCAPFIFSAVSMTCRSSLHIERLLGNVVVLSFHDTAETFTVWRSSRSVGSTRELLGHKEGLREELLNLSRAATVTF